VSTAPLDPHSNPSGREYDLGREGAFSEFKILIFNGIAQSSLEQYIVNPVNALRTKGFQVNITRKEEEFAAQLATHDEAWIVSGSSIRADVVGTFVSAVTAFHNAGKGLAIWGDNDPLFAHANAVLDPLLGLKLTGNDPALKNLAIGDPTKSGNFGRHLLTSGIVKLFEGDSICYPTNTNQVKVLATSSHNRPCMMYAEPAGKGRIVIDCGFTKFYDPQWTNTAGTERYVRNAAVWLLNLEARVPTMNVERLDVAHRQLRRGESMTLEGDLGRIMIGMGWASPFDLDVSCIVYSRDFKHLDTIWFRNLKSAKYPIKHSGDILSGGRPGDLEQITVDLHQMPNEAAILIFVVNVFSMGKTFAEVQNAYVRLVDVPHSLEKCKFELGKESMGNTRAMVMCKVFHSSDGKWKMMTIGESVEGSERTVEEVIKAGILNKYIYEDYVPAGAVVQPLA
jgi:stress response protein SCP2